MPGNKQKRLPNESTVMYFILRKRQISIKEPGNPQKAIYMSNTTLNSLSYRKYTHICRGNQPAHAKGSVFQDQLTINYWCFIIN